MRLSPLYNSATLFLSLTMHLEIHDVRLLSSLQHKISIIHMHSNTVPLYVRELVHILYVSHTQYVSQRGVTSLHFKEAI